MTESSITVKNDIGSDAAARLVQCAGRFKSQISLVSAEKTANAKSMLGIISMDVQKGNIIKIMASGEDESEALSELKNLL